MHGQWVSEEVDHGGGQERSKNLKERKPIKRGKNGEDKGVRKERQLAK
jgi:hypothetical protein